MRSVLNSHGFNHTTIVWNWLCLISLACLLSCIPWRSAFANPDIALETFSAEYTVENDYVTGGKATLSLLKNEEGSFDFILQTIPTGIFKWTGKGNIREHAVLPGLSHPFEASHYSYTDKGDSDRNYQIEFDRSGGDYRINRSGNSNSQSLATGTLDRLSVTLLIMHEIQNNPDFSKIEADILSGSQAQKIVFTKQGSESVKTGIGVKNAIRIHKERESSNRKTIIWLAPVTESGQSIPVKIEQFKRNKLTMRLILTKFSAVE